MLIKMWKMSYWSAVLPRRWRWTNAYSSLREQRVLIKTRTKLFSTIIWIEAKSYARVKPKHFSFYLLSFALLHENVHMPLHRIHRLAYAQFSAHNQLFFSCVCCIHLNLIGGYNISLCALFSVSLSFSTTSGHCFHYKYHAQFVFTEMQTLQYVFNVHIDSKAMPTDGTA